MATAIFVAGSLGATFSPSLGVLIAMRVLQGIGAGMVQGCGMGMMLASFPDSERGKALGTHLSVVGLGAIAGPAMGGFLVAWFGWQSVFLRQRSGRLPGAGAVVAVAGARRRRWGLPTGPQRRI